MTVATPFDHVNLNSYNKNNYKDSEHQHTTNENSLVTMTDNIYNNNSGSGSGDGGSSNYYNTSVSAVVYPTHSRREGNQ